MADAGAGGKLKVFISYSRRDSAAFADELVAGLELAGFAPFLDLHDIAAGEDWEARLGGLIAESDTVVFVVSPEAVKSERCTWEVDRTTELSKRLLPVIFKPVPEHDFPKSSGVCSSSASTAGRDLRGHCRSSRQLCGSISPGFASTRGLARWRRAGMGEDARNHCYCAGMTSSGRSNQNTTQKEMQRLVRGAALRASCVRSQWATRCSWCVYGGMIVYPSGTMLTDVMNLPRRRFLHFAVGAAALPAVSRIARAQTYPSRPVRAVVAFAPGGVTDTFARLMAQKLADHLGKQVSVENIAGASGNIGTGQVAKAAPDGYTILFAFSSHVVNPTLFARVPYDPVKDFEPVTLAVASTTVLTVNPAVRARTVKELVDLINPANTASVQRGRAPRRISPANSSACGSASISFTCPSAAARLRSPRWSEGTRPSALSRRKPPCSTSRKEPCARSRSPARRARRYSPTCRP
jgi:hypothetical protein